MKARKYSVQVRKGRCIDRVSVFLIGLVLAGFTFLAGVPMTLLAYTYEKQHETVAEHYNVPTQYIGLGLLGSCPVILFIDFIFFRLYIKDRNN
jgi:hypothetical protein